MNGMEKITARMKEDAARSLSELNAQTEQELRRIREESAARAEKAVSYTHLTLPTTPYV